MTLAKDAEYMIVYGPKPAETVTYCGFKEIPRNIQVQIMRNPLQPVGGEKATQSRATKSNFVVVVVNDPILGLAIPQKGQDIIELKEHLGDTEKTRYVVNAVLHEDAGLFKLEVMK